MSLLPFVGGYDRVVYNFNYGEEYDDVAIYQNIGERLIEELSSYLNDNYNDVVISDGIFSDEAIADYLSSGSEFYGIKVGTAKVNSSFVLENSSYEIVPFVCKSDAVSTDEDAIKNPYIAVIDSSDKEAEDVPGAIIKIVNKYIPFKIINFE